VTKETEKYDIAANPVPFIGNYVDLYYLSQAFSITNFMLSGPPMVAKVDRWQQTLLSAPSNIWISDEYILEDLSLIKDGNYLSINLKKNDISVYNKARFFDFSVLPFGKMSHDFIQYDAQINLSVFNIWRMRCGAPCDVDEYFTDEYDKSTLPLMQIALIPSSEIGERNYTIATFDMLMGTIGGFISLVFMFFNSCVEGYEEFSRDLSLVENFYSTDSP
jgi:hypothetical protein